MAKGRKTILGFVFFALACAFTWSFQRADFRVSLDPESSKFPSHAAEDDVPAYHAQPTHGALPSTMSPSEFTDVVVQNAYALAARVRKLLYQQPCYCHCDRSQDHGSLLDCFVSAHGAGCGICLREALYTYEQARKGKTAAQIRQGIIRGDWQQVDMMPYQKPLPTPHQTSR